MLLKIDLNIFLFFSTKSKRVSPGFCGAPAVITIISALRASLKSAPLTQPVCTKQSPSPISITSPCSFLSLISIKRISEEIFFIAEAYAAVEPTAPAPIIAIFGVIICRQYTKNSPCLASFISFILSFHLHTHLLSRTSNNFHCCFYIVCI